MCLCLMLLYSKIGEMQDKNGDGNNENRMACIIENRFLCSKQKIYRQIRKEEIIMAKKERVVKIPSIQENELLQTEETVTVNAEMDEDDGNETEQDESIAEDKVERIVGLKVDDADETNSNEDPDDGWVDDEDDSFESEDSEKAKSTSHRSIYDLMEADIMASDISDSEKAKRLSYLIKIRNRKVNIILTGATGSGKSSTINAMFDMDVAKVGVGVDPETMVIEKFELDNLIIWDTPGLGDGVESDKHITREIVRKLSETDEEGKPLIDMVAVILDASSKDLGTSYDLINKVLIPCLDKDAEKRILVGLNQSDIAMKGKHWDAEKNEPDEVLKDFLEKKAESVRERIKSATGLDIRPVCY